MLMNKKLGIIIGVIVLVLLLGVGGYYVLHTSKTNIPYASSGQQKTSGTVFSSIQEALMNHLSLSCDYTSGDMHTVAYIKNGMVRADITNSTDSSQSGSVIMKDKKMYYWNGKTGMMMVMPDVTGTAPTGTVTQDSNGQNTVQNLEQYKQYCKTATVDGSKFDVPSDVKFTDETQMMHAMPSMTIPSGTMNSQQVQQYMQQYHITPQAQ